MRYHTIRNSAIIIIAMSALLLSSCKEESIDLEEAEMELIEQFMSKYGFDIQKRSSGLYFQETVEGNGNTPVQLDTVSVYYTGYFLSGLKFDGNRSDPEPFSFVVNNYPSEVIDGWEEGIKLMTEGGEARLIVPSWLGYGSRGTGIIPGYTPLYFEVELVSIKPGPNHK